MSGAMALLPPSALSLRTCLSATATTHCLASFPSIGKRRSRKRLLGSCSAVREKEAKAAPSETNNSSSVEEVTEKFGLEAGLWKIFTSKDEEGSGEQLKVKKKNQAKELLARYGGAYLVTSISLSLVSFSLCYILINAGVDVQGLLDKIGIHTDETGEKVGTLALAYAAHKAASPIRFPPTVALTPIVAGWFGNRPKQDEANQTKAE